MGYTLTLTGQEFMHYHRVISIVAVALLVTSCGVSRKAGRTVGLRNDPKFVMNVNVSENANGNNPVAVDFVMLLDKKLVKEVAKLSAKDWFERRLQVQRDFPGKSEIVSWEWVPRQTAGPIAIAVNPATKGAFMFASYTGPGDHRAAIDVRSSIVLNLQQERFNVQAVR